jgi:hypothetical protein
MGKLVEHLLHHFARMRGAPAHARIGASSVGLHRLAGVTVGGYSRKERRIDR